MQTAPVELLPVDPAPRTARREPVDRGFADLVARDEHAARADSPRADAPRPERQKPPAEPAAKAEPATGVRSDRADKAGRDMTGRGAAQTEAAGSAAEAAPESGDPVAAAMTADAPETQAAPQTPATPLAGGRQLPHAAGATGAPTAEQTAPDSSAAAASSTTVAAAAAVPPLEDAPATPNATGADAALDVTAAAGPAGVSTAPNIAGAGPDLAIAAAGEQTPAQVRADTAGTPQTPAGAIDAASTGVATAAARQAGAMRGNADATAPAGPASAAASADLSAEAGEGDGAHALTRGAADATSRPTESAPGQNKDMAGRATFPAQSVATGQTSEQPAGGSRAGVADILTAGSEPGARADAPPPGQPAAQGQSASLPTSFANELRLATGAPAAPDAAAGRPPPGPVLDQMAVQISRAVTDGQDRLTIDLRPAVLGRVSVSLEVGHDHRVIAVISADRADTLDLLQRDARALERALQDAGLKTDSGSLSFSLNGDGAKKSPFGDGANPEQLVAARPSDDEVDSPSAAHTPYARVLNPAGIDIHV